VNVKVLLPVSVFPFAIVSVPVEPVMFNPLMLVWFANAVGRSAVPIVW
jgi:hypothetical protein